MLAAHLLTTHIYLCVRVWLPKHAHIVSHVPSIVVIAARIASTCFRPALSVQSTLIYIRLKACAEAIFSAPLWIIKNVFN